jgi:hypothetical protein
VIVPQGRSAGAPQLGDVTGEGDGVDVPLGETARTVSKRHSARAPQAARDDLDGAAAVDAPHLSRADGGDEQAAGLVDR